jgi:uncharacterized protein (DUF2132 family)
MMSLAVIAKILPAKVVKNQVFRNQTIRLYLQMKRRMKILQTRTVHLLWMIQSMIQGNHQIEYEIDLTKYCAQLSRNKVK